MNTTTSPTELPATPGSGFGRHLSNIGDHRRPHAQMMHCYSSHAYSDPSARNHEWQSHLRWINENVIGPPKATDHYTQEQLEAMGMIGIYAPLDSQNAAAHPPADEKTTNNY